MRTLDEDLFSGLQAEGERFAVEFNKEPSNIVGAVFHVGRNAAMCTFYVDAEEPEVNAKSIYEEHRTLRHRDPKLDTIAECKEQTHNNR
ncbi:hypothetical protein MAR_033458 [Mya arenaria]|uniref:Uncharacterized protein n=1 Tax=Mya arenaria TaxID=6604 RepID=A0ABY7GD85_MYAAR|nr:hypothetical protein MAR_033458 [Mya arenaria]